MDPIPVFAYPATNRLGTMYVGVSLFFESDIPVYPEGLIERIFDTGICG